ncbi:hypothetical protein [Nonomuraea diastatica]|uniref:Uncharacterized protein n=1 Tax=Nonomuraea diastatica TaxID=1848329 RepID=A0A4R4WG68_9ACTN|nr:hypothetical protein [Nonomuraea diastatica]TDD17922.1 hypothetical protein E1294_26335 [Nonomuraea diastatica]
MRTPPHLPARARHEPRDTEPRDTEHRDTGHRDTGHRDTGHARRHPYGLHEIPAQAGPHGTLAFPDTLPPDEPDEYVEQRLLEIREMSNQAIGSIDDLLQHTA